MFRSLVRRLKPNENVRRLKRAKALIATPDKWCQGVSSNDKGQHCALNACYATGADTPFSHVTSYLFRALPYGRSVIAFNDNPKTTHKDIMDLFDRAIELAR